MGLENLSLAALPDEEPTPQVGVEVLETSYGTCLCCAHPQRYILERRLTREMATQPTNPQGDPMLSEEFIEDLALEFDLSPEEIMHHADFHMSVKPGQTSLETKCDLQEATILTDTLYDSVATIDHVGKIIRNMDSGTLSRALSKEIVDLYTNAQRAARDSVELLMKMDAQMNGTRDQASTSLDALTAVIAASQQALLEQQNTLSNVPEASAEAPGEWQSAR